MSPDLPHTVVPARRHTSWRSLLAVPALVAGLGAAGLAPATAAPAPIGTSTTAPAPAPAPGLPPQGPAGDAFYTPPSPLPAGQPGDIIWQRVTAQDSKVTTYLVLYLSTTATGQPTAVSGTIAVPKKLAAGSPVIGVAPGTTGIGDQCASSRMGLNFVWSPDFVADGFVQATTDYEGLGTPGAHTYVVGRSEGHAVIDIVRAATRLGAGPTTASPVGFVGYSQGGGGAAWAGELAPSYGPELDVKAIAAGGVPADMVAVGKFLDGGLGMGFLAAAAVGFDAAYPELDLPAYLNPNGVTVFEENAGSCVQDVILKLAGKKISEFTTSNPMNTPAWQARLRENSLGTSPPKAPIFLYHGSFDEILPYDQGKALRDTYCRAGRQVTWTSYFGEHVSTLVTGAGDVHTFVADRIRGKAKPGNC